MHGRGCREQIPAEVKAAYLRKLIDGGLHAHRCGEFCFAGAVPQMADSEQVLDGLLPPDEVEIIGIVVNEKGAERAIAHGRGADAGISVFDLAGVSRRNQHQTPEEALDTLQAICTLAQSAEHGMWSRTCRWRSAILMAMRGVWTKC